MYTRVGDFSFYLAVQMAWGVSYGIWLPEYLRDVFSFEELQNMIREVKFR